MVKVPIFPLPASIIFPGIYLPLHIFEDRYKKMLANIEATQGELAISFAPELQPGQFYPSRLCGAGPLQVIKRYPNNDADVVIFGMKRIQFSNFIQEEPYLIGEGEYVEIERDMPEKTEKQLHRYWGSA